MSSIKHKLRRLSRQTLNGSGSMYVLLTLGLVSGLSYMLTGGLVPNIQRMPDNPEVVEIEQQITPLAQQSLQMRNIEIKPTVTPTPVLGCISRTAINLLVDQSYSMRNFNKDVELRRALNEFVTSLEQVSGSFYIGIDTFGPGDYGNGGARTDLQFTEYASNRDLVRSVIDNLNPGELGGTYMRQGFNVATQKIIGAKETSGIEDYQFVNILFSDGIPEQGSFTNPDECLVVAENIFGQERCFSIAQDPRFDKTDEMKSLTDKAYTVLITSDDQTSVDYKMRDQLFQLVRDASDEPESTYVYLAYNSDPGELTDIFTSIPQTICN